MNKPSTAFINNHCRAFIAIGYFLISTNQASAIVNGSVAGNTKYGAVVSLSVGGMCTGTFVHPRFILTAAHCVDNFRTTDGPLSGVTAFDGVKAFTGTKYDIDYVYFARPEDLHRNIASDVAMLRTKAPFLGKPIPTFANQDIPKPDERAYCRRWEFTWPYVLGYSDNAGSTDRRRRVGRAFAECDLELEKTTFKLDGHGRSGQHGIRTCPGDSGGPVLWETGFGGYAVGGVTSRGDNYRFITNTRCPSERGESYQAFIPVRFLDRIAQTDRICRDAQRWEHCAGQPTQYGGYRLRYLGTEIDQCGRKSLGIPDDNNNTTTWIQRGRTGASEVGNHRYRWYCGSTRNREWTTARDGARFIIAKRGLTDRQIIWDTYEILRRPICKNIVGQNWDNRRIIPMFSWYSSSRTDQALMYKSHWYGCDGDRKFPDYYFNRVEGFAYSPDLPQPDGTVALYHWNNAATGDNMTTSHPNYARPWLFKPGDQYNGYTLVGVAGYIYPPDSAPRPDLVPLHSWWSYVNKESFSTTDAAWHGTKGKWHIDGYPYYMFRHEGFLLRAN